jgi:serine phosphatase RsbU (regulator of sigma subunit)
VVEVAGTDPVLGAFVDATWEIARCAIGPGQQLVIVTDGVTEAGGCEGRFGEARLRAELRGVTDPAQAVHRLEGALHAFSDGGHDDDVAVLAIARASAERSGNVTRLPVASGASLDRGNG